MTCARWRCCWVGPARTWSESRRRLIRRVCGLATSATLTAHLCGRDLPRLREAGPVAELIARQGEAHGVDFAMAALGAAHAGLPEDLLNFQYDPVACLVALGWSGATMSHRRLSPSLVDDHLIFQPDQRGVPMSVVDRIDGPRFATTGSTLSRQLAGPPVVGLTDPPIRSGVRIRPTYQRTRSRTVASSALRVTPSLA